MIPRHIPEAIGSYVEIKYYVNSNHSANMENRRSHSGIVIYINNAPIIWYSRCQNPVEASNFVLDYVALRISIEIIETLWYNLRCSGGLVDGPAEVFCDKKSVVNNLIIPTSVLN